MNKANYIQILKNPSSIQQENTSELKIIIDEFPYFQSARALYLKGLKNNNSFKYNNELKTTAAYTTDRTILFNLITSEVFKEEKTITQKPIIKETQQNTRKEVIKLKEELSIGKPLTFSQNETLSFNQWLKLSVIKPINRTNEVSKTTKKSSIIDRFIATNPKIPKIKNEAIYEVKINKNEQPNSLMTETLAKVYLEQKKYGNAIKAYQILSLKYPEKSGFFADQIKRIQILQKHK